VVFFIKNDRVEIFFQKPTIEKSGRKIWKNFCFFTKKQVFLSRRNKRGIMSKKRKKALMETICFFVYTKKKALAKLTIFRKVG